MKTTDGITITIPGASLEQFAGLVAAHLASHDTTGEPVSAAIAAKLLGVSPGTIYRATRRGTLKKVPGLNKTLIPRSEILRVQRGGRL
jgi:excisionase family DNA binding protein